MMALAIVTTFEQYDANKWLVEIEVGGLVCKRAKFNARTLPEACEALLSAYRAIATPEMLEAQGMAGEIVDPGHDNGVGWLGNPQIRENAEEDRRAAKREQMARVRAAKAAKHAKEVMA